MFILLFKNWIETIGNSRHTYKKKLVGVFSFMLFICKLMYGDGVGQEVVCYESPRPTVGIHRFVFVLFRQLGRQTVYAPGWRQNFNTRDFAELYNLGLPVAAVYFNCQRESGSGGRRT